MVLIIRKSDNHNENFEIEKTRLLLLKCMNIEPNIHKHINMNLLIDKINEEISFAKIDGTITIDTLKQLLIKILQNLITVHYTYSTLAARIEMYFLHKEIDESLFSSTLESNKLGMLSDKYFEFVSKNFNDLQKMFDFKRDFLFDFIGIQLLKEMYLLTTKEKKPIERPQHMWMRSAIQVHLLSGNLENIKETYDALSEHFYTHGSSTLCNSGLREPQLANCFLQAMKGDSIDGIYSTLKESALFSKGLGGVGFSISNIRAQGSMIKTTNRPSKGILPIAKLYNETVLYVDQAGKRPGAIAPWIQPWHKDIFTFLDLKKNNGNEASRARDLFYGLWVPDLLIKRAQANEKWTLFCPSETPKLVTTYGEEFERLYEEYEKDEKICKVVKNAIDVWNEICMTIDEVGLPYVCAKDAVNEKSNQKNIGPVLCSNLCSEIMEHTSENEVAVCNLASLCLQKFVNINEKSFDYEKLMKITKLAIRNLNHTIDCSYYPVEAARRSNTNNRPLGLGVQGLADVFQMLKIPFDSTEARELNSKIFETIYFAALEASHEMAVEIGKPYNTYEGSPISKGIFQFDMWKEKPLSRNYDWQSLREKITKKGGIYNSLLIAIMPTVSTSALLGNNACIEPINSNLYLQKNTAGNYIKINKYLIDDLVELGLWNDDMKNELILHEGSVQEIDSIPVSIKSIYKTAWEISAKVLIDLAADRGKDICQSQSLNLFLPNSNIFKLSSALAYGWSKGLKTLIYYRVKRPSSSANKSTIDPLLTIRKKEKNVIKRNEELQKSADVISSSSINTLIEKTTALATQTEVQIKQEPSLVTINYIDDCKSC